MPKNAAGAAFHSLDSFSLPLKTYKDIRPASSLTQSLFSYTTEPKGQNDKVSFYPFLDFSIWEEKEAPSCFDGHISSVEHNTWQFFSSCDECCCSCCWPAAGLPLFTCLFHIFSSSTPFWNNKIRLINIFRLYGAVSARCQFLFSPVKTRLLLDAKNENENKS